MKKNKLVGGFVIGTFVMLYILVSLISTIHVIDFFELSNPRSMAIALAVAFEIGAAASLASLVTLDKMNKTLVWALFIAITAMQMQGNMYYAFMNLESYETWSELFNLIEEEPLYQKRILAFVSGAILPLVALGFIKSLVDYIKPEDEKVIEEEPGKQSNPGEPEDIFDWDRFTEEDNDWDEDHALDMVMNDMVEDLDSDINEFEEIEDILANQEFDNEDLFTTKDVNPFLDQPIKTKVQPKSETNMDVTYEFGKNLYNNVVNKVNADHLQVDKKPSKEEITEAYKNLGLVNKRK